MDLNLDFNNYWSLIGGDEHFADRKQAAREEWSKHPEKHEAIIRWLTKHGKYVDRNPYFFIQDFKYRAPTVIGEPTNWNGRALKEGVKYISAKYNGVFGLYTEEDVRKFGLQVAER